jgi:hypothetical protein
MTRGRVVQSRGSYDQPLQIETGHPDTTMSDFDVGLIGTGRELRDHLPNVQMPESHAARAAAPAGASCARARGRECPYFHPTSDGVHSESISAFGVEFDMA